MPKNITNHNLLTSIELNLTELCNLKCLMCPRAYDYPNRNLHMSLETHSLILNRIEDFVKKHIEHHEYVYAAYGNKFYIQMIGRGEPSLHKHFRKVLEDYIELSKKYEFLEIVVVTNGYKIEQYEDLYKQIGVSLNLYYNKTIKDFKYYKERYKDYPNIVVHWRNESDDTKDKRPNKSIRGYNNRAGKIHNEFTIRDNEDLTSLVCNKPFNNLYIDWNGDYNLCCNDWEYIKVFGNIKEEPIHDYYFKNEELLKYKRMLLNNKRKASPCSTCNARCHPSFLTSLKEASNKGFDVKN